MRASLMIVIIPVVLVVGALLLIALGFALGKVMSRPNPTPAPPTGPAPADPAAERG